MSINGHRSDYVDLPPAGWSFICDHRIVAPKMLVKGLLPYRGIAFIGGQFGAGKTFVAADLAVALGSATSFFNRTVKERVGVGIIAAEGAEQIAPRRSWRAPGIRFRRWRGSARVPGGQGAGEGLFSLRSAPVQKAEKIGP